MHEVHLNCSISPSLLYDDDDDEIFQIYKKCTALFFQALIPYK